MSKKIRSFIAINLPEEIHNNLSQTIQQLKKDIPQGVRWVKPPNIHLTLKFLGEISIEDVEKIKSILEDIANECSSFQVKVTGLGAFPNLEIPRVVWAGLVIPPELVSLNKKIQTEIEKIGFPAEKRPFSPHLTLGRISRNASRSEILSIPSVIAKTDAQDLGSFEVTDITLFRSDLHPDGARYTILYSANLKSG